MAPSSARLQHQEHGHRCQRPGRLRLRGRQELPVNIALHTDHCPRTSSTVSSARSLAISAERVKAGQLPLFQSHMWDGSAVPLTENPQIAEELLALAKAARIILEVEIGVVGGEEDGVVRRDQRQAVHDPEDALATVAALGLGEQGRYMSALTFGNVHGSTSRATSSCARDPRDCQDAVVAKYGGARRRRWTWSSTAGPARCPRRSPRPSTTAWSR